MRKYTIHVSSAFGLLFFSGCSTLCSLFGISFGVLFLIWIVPSLIPALIASNKGRSGLGLFLLSIFFTPIVGLIVALIIAPINKTTESEQAPHIIDKATEVPPLSNETLSMAQEVESDIKTTILYWLMWAGVAVIIYLIAR
jgi:hypothetical protein